VGIVAALVRIPERQTRLGGRPESD
jgi:hypothetical protein